LFKKNNEGYINQSVNALEYERVQSQIEKLRLQERFKLRDMMDRGKRIVINLAGIQIRASLVLRSMSNLKLGLWFANDMAFD